MKNLNNLAYFYCPKCGKEEVDIDMRTMGEHTVNFRGGYGIPILHFTCPNCGNLLAGGFPVNAHYDREYQKELITEYNEGGMYFNSKLLDFLKKEANK